MRFDSTLGALLLGGFLTAVLYGITCIQCFIYYQRSAQDRWLLKGSVILLWLVNTLHMVGVIHPIYWYAVTNRLNAESLSLLPWSIPAGIVLMIISDSIARCWFSYRVWILSHRNLWLAVPLVFLDISLAVLGEAYGIKGFFSKTLEELSQSTTWLLKLILVAIVFTDFYIAGSLCIYLYGSRRHFNRRTDSALNVMMLYAIQTGLATSVFALVCFITYATMPHNQIFIAMYFPLCELYANSFMASLNARDWMNNALVSGATTLSSGNVGKQIVVSVHTERQESSGSLSQGDDVELGKYGGSGDRSIKQTSVAFP